MRILYWYAFYSVQAFKKEKTNNILEDLSLTRHRWWLESDSRNYWWCCWNGAEVSIYWYRHQNYICECLAFLRIMSCHFIDCDVFCVVETEKLTFIFARRFAVFSVFFRVFPYLYNERLLLGCFTENVDRRVRWERLNRSTVFTLTMVWFAFSVHTLREFHTQKDWEHSLPRFIPILSLIIEFMHGRAGDTITVARNKDTECERASDKERTKKTGNYQCIEQVVWIIALTQATCVCVWGIQCEHENKRTIKNTTYLYWKCHEM